MKRTPFEFHLFFSLRDTNGEGGRGGGARGGAVISQVPCAHLLRRIPYFSDRSADRPGRSYRCGARYLCFVSVFHGSQAPESAVRICEYASGIGVARGIVPPSLILERAGAIDDQVVRQVSAISTEGANLTFSDDYESGGLRPDRRTRKTYVAPSRKPPTKMFSERNARFFSHKYLDVFLSMSLCKLHI